MHNRIGMRNWLHVGAVLMLSASAVVAHAAPLIDKLDVDISPLIDEAARYPTRFAVDVGHPVSTTTMGEWSQSGQFSTWIYTARIETAVSLGFHASKSLLPASAELKVTGARGTLIYRSGDIHRGELWARHVAGDTVSLALTVKSTERSQVRLEIQSFQAGYRGVAGAIADNAHYHQIIKSSTGGDCTENYACDATTANQGPAHATVAIVIGNVGQCTGTLLNNTSADGTPYLLTARHCESGNLGAKVVIGSEVRIDRQPDFLGGFLHSIPNGFGCVITDKLDGQF